MRYPKGKVLQKNLDTTYVNIGQVLGSLGSENFVGYVRAVFDDAEGLIFIRDSELIAALFEYEGDRTLGLDGLVKVLDKIKSSRAFLDICKIDYDLLSSLLGLIHGTGRTVPPGEIPRTIPELKNFVERNTALSGLLLEKEGEQHYVYCADGNIVGFFSPPYDQLLEQLPLADLSGAGASWTRWDCPGTHTMRTVDLTLQKKRVLEEMRGICEKFIPGYGSYLLFLEYQNFKKRLPHLKSFTREQFYRLHDGLKRRCRSLVGARKSDTLSLEIKNLFSRIIDLEI